MPTNRPVETGSTDVSVEIEAWDATNGLAKTDITHATSGLEIRYWESASGTVTTVTPVTQTSTGAHTDGGIVHKHGGVYRVDLPDAAVDAAAGTEVTVSLAGVADTYFSKARLLITADNTYAAGLTAAAVNTAVEAGTVGTEVTAIKAKTDSLAFTKAGEVDANVRSANGATMTGNGTSGNKWRGA